MKKLLLLLLLFIMPVYGLIPSFSSVDSTSEIYAGETFEVFYSVTGSDLSMVDLYLRDSSITRLLSNSCSGNSCSGNFELSLDSGRHHLVLVARDSYGSRRLRSYFVDILEADYIWKTNSWSDCSKDCGDGIKTRDVFCVNDLTDLMVDDSFCDSSKPVESQSCNTHACPVDCEVSEWSLWSDCSQECDSGTQSRTRSVLVEPLNGGLACPSLSESQSCNTHACPVDCEVSEWSLWSDCSQECDGGKCFS